jgi:hypothetical protein
MSDTSFPFKKREYHMQKLNRSSKAGREIKSATLVPKFQNKRKVKREGSTVPPGQRTRRGSLRPAGPSRLSSVVTDAGDGSADPARSGEIPGPGTPRRSARERSRVTYTEAEESGGLDARLDERENLRDQTPLFARKEGDDETEEIRVKEEPMDDEEMPLQAITAEPIDGAPHLPVRDESELQAMREGAAVAGHRTDLGTGLEDPEDGFVDHADGRRRAGSPDPREDTGLDGMGDVEEEDGKEFKPVTRLSYAGERSVLQRRKTHVRPSSYRTAAIGFSISTRHLVLIIEPWPPMADLPKASSRSRSLYSRSMTRDVSGRESTLNLGLDNRSQTPLIPNSRRGGTSVTDRPTATPGLGGHGGSRWSATPAASFGRGTPGPSSRNASALPSRLQSQTPGAGRASTPLFREATPFGDDDDEEEEDDEWKEKAQNASWAPSRGGSEAPEGFGFKSGLAEDLGNAGDDDGDADEDIQEARGMLAMSQRIQQGTSSRRSGNYSAAGEVDGGDGDVGDAADDGVGDDGGGAD